MSPPNNKIELRNWTGQEFALANRASFLLEMRNPSFISEVVDDMVNVSCIKGIFASARSFGITRNVELWFTAGLSA